MIGRNECDAAGPAGDTMEAAKAESGMQNTECKMQNAKWTAGESPRHAIMQE
jgi:hypothetical protein